MPEFKLLPADIIFTHGSSWVSSSIRWMTRGRHEAKTYANHVAIAGTRGTVVEALVRVTQTSYSKWVSQNPHYRVYRCTALSDIERLKIATFAEIEVGRKYGYLKIGAHALDCLLQKALGGNIYLFRRACFMKAYPICSWLAAWSYWCFGKQIGGPPAYEDPDSMEDFVKASQEWALVLEC